MVGWHGTTVLLRVDPKGVFLGLTGVAVCGGSGAGRQAGCGMEFGLEVPVCGGQASAVLVPGHLGFCWAGCVEW